MQELIKEIAELFHTRDYRSILSALLELGLQINEKIPGIPIDEIRAKMTIIELFDAQAIKNLSVLYDSIHEVYRGIVDEEREQDPRITHAIAPLKLALAVFKPASTAEPINVEEIGDSGFTDCKAEVEIFINRAVKLSQANVDVQKLEQYKQEQLYSSDEQTVAQKKATESILADFRRRRCDYFNGNNAAFNGIESANRKHLNVLKATKSQALKIFASVLASLTVVGLVVGIGQAVTRKVKGQPAAFLFYKERSADKMLHRMVSVATPAPKSESAPVAGG
jgi:hypothetical protein